MSQGACQDFAGSVGAGYYLKNYNCHQSMEPWGCYYYPANSAVTYNACFQNPQYNECKDWYKCVCPAAA